MKIITKKHQNDILDDVVKLHDLTEKHINDLDDYTAAIRALANITTVVSADKTLLDIVEKKEK